MYRKYFGPYPTATATTSMLNHFHLKLFAPHRLNSFEPIPISIRKITMTDYTKHHYDNELLRQSATQFANFTINPTADLAEVRKIIENFCNESAASNGLKLSDWCFLDCECWRQNEMEMKLNPNLHENCFHFCHNPQLVRPNVSSASIARRSIYIIWRILPARICICWNKRIQRCRQHPKMKRRPVCTDERTPISALVRVRIWIVNRRAIHHRHHRRIKSFSIDPAQGPVPVIRVLTTPENVSQVRSVWFRLESESISPMYYVLFL